MKTVGEKKFEMFSEYTLSGFEMFNIRGGGDAGCCDPDPDPDPDGCEMGGDTSGDEPSDPEKSGQVIIP